MSLAELNARAELLARRDNSYLVPVSVFEDFAARLTDPHRPGGRPAFRVLAIDGLRCFRYRSTYYDPPELRTFHDHRQGRRRRFRIRERVYEDSGERQFEAKLKSGRGETVKQRQRMAGGDRPLDGVRLRFLARVLRESYGMLDVPHGLPPSLRTDYRRVTFVADGQRVTCDAGLVVRDEATGGRAVADGGLVLVETKTRGHLTEADRMLHGYGVRPAGFTKYSAGLAAVRPELGANAWARVVRRVFP
ncbi:VTC domain-containing protein [Streptomyces sp. NL15-2K]|uniref:VTC domain-containing protein n=1 Tax=Streptomyces sp. NL15-2K TaxID=376149 RepID=UPI000F55E7BB|nr:VTC domain-containing protein [Streptomyces sp. NL15-2K]